LFFVCLFVCVCVCFLVAGKAGNLGQASGLIHCYLSSGFARSYGEVVTAVAWVVSVLYPNGI
jgi:hypothetical protein